MGPLVKLDFTSHSYHTGSHQDKKCFDTVEKAWQGCAKQCNWRLDCHTYAVEIKDDGGSCVSTTCYQHNPYKSNYQIKETVKLEGRGDPSSGTFGVFRESYTDYHVSGVCRL